MGGKIYRDCFGEEFDPDELVHSGELQARLHIKPWSFGLMRVAGFPMPFGRNSYNGAIKWWFEFYEEHGREFSANWVHKNRAKFRKRNES